MIRIVPSSYQVVVSSGYHDWYSIPFFNLADASRFFRSIKELVVDDELVQLVYHDNYYKERVIYEKSV